MKFLSSAGIYFVGLVLTVWCVFALWGLSNYDLTLPTVKLGPFIRIFVVSRIACGLFELAKGIVKGNE